MTTTTVGYQFHSEAFRKVAAEAREFGEARGQAIGEARGEALAILTVLDARGIPVPASIREQILACTEHDQLDAWLRRAAFATAAEDVVSG